jgi:hypothetical protein
MLRTLLNTGLHNPTLWVALIAAASALIAALRGRAARPVPRLLTSAPFLALLSVAVSLNLAFGIYKGYVAPRDLMQDMVSAQEFLAGRSLYPDHMNALMRDALTREPPRSLLDWSPDLRAREIDAREETLSQHWVQAHPPLMSLAVAPLVASVGLGGTYFAVTLLSLACLALTLALLARGLGLRPTPREWLLLGLVLLGWDSAVMLLRAGQPGLLLGALLTAGWFLLRRGRPYLAGVAIGLAVGVKLFPALLLFYLLLRHRRAFLTAMLTLAALFVLIGAVAGWDTYREHLETARGVVSEYAAYPANLSLLGLMARLEAPSGWPHPVARALFCGAGAVVVGLLALFVRRKRAGGDSEPERFDGEYALFMVLMVVLSPVAWDHYLPVLILPLAVLARRALAQPARSFGPAAFFALAVALTVPDTAFTTAAETLSDPVSSLLVRWLVLPLRTYALAALACWLVRLGLRKDQPAATAGRLTPPPGWLLVPVLFVAVAAHLLVGQPAEPYFNNDETRHVMTGVYFHDLLIDRPAGHLSEYTVGYYLQYPALGLLVWPPFFHAVEGVAMLALGTSFGVARLLVALFALLACLYLHALVRHTHGGGRAALAVLLFALCPLVFQYSHQVMLEVPSLALALAAVYHCQRYLDEGRRRDLALCCAATALTALTRFDGVFLAPTFLILLLGRRRLGVLRRKGVILGALAAVLAVAPVYLLTAWESGGAHLQAMREGTAPTSTGLLDPRNFVFYPACVPQQIGWFATLPAILGLGAALLTPRRAASWPYLALVGGTYLTFTPMAELEPRHAIYWVPALALFCADGIALLASWARRVSPRAFTTVGLQGAFAGVVLAGTVWPILARPVRYVRGYEEAARYVVEHSTDRPVCLFDGLLNGGFIYQVRRCDPCRRLWVLRGDKVMYGMLSEPHAGYEEWVKDEDDVLAVLTHYDPELIVVEEPQLRFDLPAARLLRAALRDHPERFRREKVIALDSNYVTFAGAELHVFRNLPRSDSRAAKLEVKMLGLGGRTLEAPAPR